jgi:hypothetical protein
MRTLNAASNLKLQTSVLSAITSFMPAAEFQPRGRVDCGYICRRRRSARQKVRYFSILATKLAETEGDERQILKRGNSRLYR